MPELPEVEQVRVSLLPHIKGKTILTGEGIAASPYKRQNNFKNRSPAAPYDTPSGCAGFYYGRGRADDYRCAAQRKIPDIAVG